MKHSGKYCMKGAITYFSFPVKIMKIVQVLGENAVFYCQLSLGCTQRIPPVLSIHREHIDTIPGSRTHVVKSHKGMCHFAHLGCPELWEQCVPV